MNPSICTESSIGRKLGYSNIQYMYLRSGTKIHHPGEAPKIFEKNVSSKIKTAWELCEKNAFSQLLDKKSMLQLRATCRHLKKVYSPIVIKKEDQAAFLLELGTRYNWDFSALLRSKNTSDKKIFRELQNSITSLTISFSFLIDTQKLRTIHRFFPDLTSLSIDGATLDEEALRLITTFKKLTTFSLTNSSNRTLPPFSEHSKLEELILKGCAQLTHEGIPYLPNLKKLSIDSCPRITHLPQLDENCALEHLELSRVGIRNHETLSLLRNLRSLTIHHCLSIHGLPRLSNTVEELSLIITFSDNASLAFIRDLPQIRKLHLAGYHIPYTTLPPLQSHTKLESLFLYGCTHIRTEDLKKIDNLPSLKELKISYAPKIKRLPLFSKEGELKKLTLSYCDKLTNEALKPLGELSSLQELTLSSLYFTHLPLSEKNQHLHTIELISCPLFENEGIYPLTSLPHCRHLTLRSNSHINHLPSFPKNFPLQTVLVDYPWISLKPIENLPLLREITACKTALNALKQHPDVRYTALGHTMYIEPDIIPEDFD